MILIYFCFDIIGPYAAIIIIIIIIQLEEIQFLS